MNYEEKLKLAKQAYKEIRQAIDKYKALGNDLSYWDGSIQVDKDIFHEYMLVDDESTLEEK